VKMPRQLLLLLLCFQQIDGQSLLVAAGEREGRGRETGRGREKEENQRETERERRGRSVC